MKSINDALEADFWTGMAAEVNTRWGHCFEGNSQ
jgi:hypothetical protein